MFDLGWSEMAIIMLVALIVIGPKDLPKVARTIGQWTGKARALARDFQRSLDDMAREAELDEIKKSIDKVGNTSLRQVVKDAVDPDDELEQAFDVGDSKATKKPRSPSNVKPMAATTGPKTALPPTETAKTSEGKPSAASTPTPESTPAAETRSPPAEAEQPAASRG
jgi:sec-independent protein translocase protein TatB